MGKNRTATRVGVALAALLPLGGLACGGDGDPLAASDGETAARPLVVPVEPELAGEPVRLMQIGSFSSGDTNPAAREAALAAAEAVNRSGGVQGRPLELIVCDDQFSPAAAAACGQQAVDLGVVAVVGSQTTYGDAYIPVLEAAGIPTIGQLVSSRSDGLAPNSYPTTSSLISILGGMSVAEATGAESYHLLIIDSGGTLNFLRPIFEETAEGLGMEWTGDTPVPFTEVNFGSYASHVTSGASDAVGAVLGSEGNERLLEALIEQGVDFTKTPVIVNETVYQEAVERLGTGAEGLYVVGGMFLPNQTENEGVARFNEELDEVGADAERNAPSMLAWSSVHMTANLMQQLPTIDAATLVASMGTVGPLEFAGIAPWDWTEKTYSDGLLSLLNVYSNQFMVSRVIDGELVAVLDEWATIGEEIELDG